MIEFKAECGHTIRAKDEDAGGVVQCSYCGREAAVPEPKDSSLDFLFQDTPHVDEVGGKVPGRKRSRGAGLFSRRRSREFDPFAVILRLCYAALLISIVIVVGRKFLLPAVKKADLWWSTRQVDKEAEPHKRVRKREAVGAGETQSRGQGSAWAGIDKGLYVESTPPGAVVYYMAIGDADGSMRNSNLQGPERIYTHDRACPYPAGREKVSDGTYLVEVAFAWSHKNLKRFPGYVEFRNRIAEAPPRERAELLMQYFIPDGADRVFFDETKDRKFIVRQYRIEVNKGERKAVHALFLPRIPKADDSSAFSIRRIVEFLPPEKEYEFIDEGDILTELAFYTVPESDRHDVLAVLSRIGVVPCVTEEKGTLLFKIDLWDQGLRVERLDEPH